MFLCAWVGFLALANSCLITHSKTLGDECVTFDLMRVKTYFEATTIIVGDNTEARYCETAVDGQARTKLLDPVINLDQVIDFYKSLDVVNSFTYSNPDSPVTHNGVLSIGEHQSLPLYVIADIRSQHIPRASSFPGFERNVVEQMELMVKFPTDDKGHLLAHSLGGSSKPSNVIPMAINVSRYLTLVPEECDLGVPRSYWRSHELWIRKFLVHAYPNGRVAWKVAVQYEDDVIMAPETSNYYRPLSFSLQYTAYTNQNDNNSVYYNSPPMTFFNDDDNSCQSMGNVEQYLRFRRSVDLQSNCDVQVPRRATGTLGALASSDNWYSIHKVSFAYTIGGKTYIYGQSKTDRGLWFTQELLPNGQMGNEIARGYWDESYPVVFTFFIKGRQYFYSHSIETKTWFIRELLSGGKMGQVMSKGKWLTSHQVSVPYTVGGKQYFYGHSLTQRHWFIQELLPNGQMGQEISQGWWAERYPVVFTFLINGRPYIYGHSIENRTWMIRELLPDGKMGSEMSHGEWNTAHQISVPYSIDGKHYFLSQSLVGHHWSIRELLPNGHMGEETSHGDWSGYYPVVCPFLINDRHFVYIQSNTFRAWFIKELL